MDEFRSSSNAQEIIFGPCKVIDKVRHMFFRI